MKTSLTSSSVNVRSAARKAKVNAIQNVKDAQFKLGEIDVFDLQNVDLAQLQPVGQPQAADDVADGQGDRLIERVGTPCG